MTYLIPAQPPSPKSVGAKRIANHTDGALSAAVGSLYKFRLTEAITVTLPETPADGSTIDILDALENFNTYNVTVAASGSDTIQSGGETLSDDGLSIQYVYDTATTSWRLRRVT